MAGSFPPLETLVPRHIQHIEPYIPSKPDDVLRQMFGCERIYRLNNNENALGPSPKALEALAAMELFQASVYPSGDAFHLRAKLAELFGLSPDSFIVGNGASSFGIIKSYSLEQSNADMANELTAMIEAQRGYTANSKVFQTGSDLLDVLVNLKR